MSRPKHVNQSKYETKMIPLIKSFNKVLEFLVK